MLRKGDRLSQGVTEHHLSVLCCTETRFPVGVSTDVSVEHQPSSMGTDVRCGG